jgi:Predicted pyridoxal phosphate-dependent enzyme apparently involved in regulation of cell wall biogenesis
MSLENFHKWPHFDDDDIRAVENVLRSAKVNRWTGVKNLDFEKKLCETFETKYAIALTNGTVALELALYALGIGEGDEVITTCRTFMASASSVVMRGARPVVADVDPITQNITAETIRACVTDKTKAIIAVHLSGWPCEMDAIMALAKELNLYVIEDCAQAHGAKYKGKSVGSIGHIAAWSFCQDKIITTCGEGGAVTTNDESLWRKMWEYKDHGKSYDAVYNRQHPEGFRWLIESFGTNWRLSEMACAQGILWLNKLENWTAIRRKHAASYNKFLQNFNCIETANPPAHIHHAYYKFYCTVKPENLKPNWNRDRIAKEISARGVPCFSGSCWNISEEKCFKDKGWNKSEAALPNAAFLRDRTLMLLVHPTLEDNDISEAKKIISDILSEASL